MLNLADTVERLCADSARHDLPTARLRNTLVLALQRLIDAVAGHLDTRHATGADGIPGDYVQVLAALDRASTMLSENDNRHPASIAADLRSANAILRLSVATERGTIVPNKSARPTHAT